jgi:hypothetical protein
MRIGILTFHFGMNYGAVLQCYALQHYLKLQGYEVEIINFNPINNNDQKKTLYTILKKSIKSWIKNCWRLLLHPYIYYCGINQKKKFQHFRHHRLNQTRPYRFDELKYIEKEFEAIIVGSDQIWNKSQHSHGAYFLSPFTSFKGLRISYSPCCAVNSIEDNNSTFLANSLKAFDALSVRNKETFQFVKGLAAIEAPIVIDPVMLVEFDELIGVNPKKTIDKSYILAYVLGSEIDGGHKKTIDQIKKKHGKKPVYSIILSGNKPHIFSWADKTLSNVSVKDWLRLLYHAGFIYTDSFHGVLFALKFKKEFLAYYKEKTRSSRFIHLIDRYQLSEHIVDSYETALQKKSFHKSVDYENLMPLIEQDIDRSKQYLHNALSIRKYKK